MNIRLNKLARVQKYAWMVGLLNFAAVVGCGQGDKQLVPAGGIVLLDDKPIPAAYVTFIPKSGRSASGQTGADGAFRLGTYKESDGALTGQHQVTVMARGEAVEQSSTEGISVKVRGKSQIPVVYENTATSGIVFEIAPGKENRFEIKLSSKPQVR